MKKFFLYDLRAFLRFNLISSPVIALSYETNPSLVVEVLVVLNNMIYVLKVIYDGFCSLMPYDDRIKTRLMELTIIEGRIKTRFLVPILCEVSGTTGA